MLLLRLSVRRVLESRAAAGHRGPSLERSSSLSHLCAHKTQASVPSRSGDALQPDRGGDSLDVSEVQLSHDWLKVQQLAEDLQRTKRC